MTLPRAILFDLDDTIITEGDRGAILLDVAIRALPDLLVAPVGHTRWNSRPRWARSRP